MSTRSPESVPRLALTVAEAAESIGVSRRWFEEHALPTLACVRHGRRILIPTAALTAWLERESARRLG